MNGDVGLGENPYYDHALVVGILSRPPNTVFESRGSSFREAGLIPAVYIRRYTPEAMYMGENSTGYRTACL